MLRVPGLFPALVITLAASAQSRSTIGPDGLAFPGALRMAERDSGNLLAPYGAMLELEAQYRASKVFAAIYEEVRLNYEQFLGDPSAGDRAMNLPGFRRATAAEDDPVPDGYEAKPALSVILAEAAKTRVVIWGEEHHLPQTRCLYEGLLRELWKLGYRYLAAETFTDRVMEPGFAHPDPRCGYYLLDPVFAEAVRCASKLGFRLVSYDTSDAGPPGDGSFRDRTEAENLVKRIFEKDQAAKVLILCGRAHAAEVPPADGWTPMASVLKKMTGIDPFTLFAPTMTQRLSPADEDPRYRWATSRGLVPAATIFVRAKDGACLGSGHCDALPFFPRVKLESGRPDWLRTALGRVAIPVPQALLPGRGLRLAQVFPEGAPATAVPSDQVLLREGASPPALMLRPGRYWARSVDTAGAVVGPVSLVVP